MTASAFTSSCFDNYGVTGFPEAMCAVDSLNLSTKPVFRRLWTSASGCNTAADIKRLVSLIVV